MFKSVTGNPNSAEGMAMSQFTLPPASVHTNNTNETYQPGVRPWFAWRMLSGLDLDPHIRGDTAGAVKEHELLNIYCYPAEVANWAPPWLHVQLYAIRFYHTLADYGFDLRLMGRLAMAKKGYKRNYGGPKRKAAV